ncbi:MAG: hypothetical protein JWL87_280 [Candidatus Adlerbacteria bacterium]|nr:hypothetical protein [Candidatus Adlerbacteria bacterium]
MNRVEARKAVEALAQFDEDTSLLMANREELLAVHPNQWAAVYKGDISVARALTECVRGLGENAPFAAMTFLDPSRKTFILAKGPQSLNPLDLLAERP